MRAPESEKHVKACIEGGGVSVGAGQTMRRLLACSFKLDPCNRTSRKRKRVVRKSTNVVNL